MRPAALLAITMLAGCGQADRREINSAQLNRIAIQRNEAADAVAAAQLQPIAGIVAPSGYGGLECRFTQGAEILVQAFSASAAARIAGTLRVLTAEGPVGPSGGFFRDRELAISVGVEPGEQARARVTNRVTEVHEDVRGQWLCTESMAGS